MTNKKQVKNIFFNKNSQKKSKEYSRTRRATNESKNKKNYVQQKKTIKDYTKI